MTESTAVIAHRFKPPEVVDSFTTLRQPPHNLEVEQALLGAVLMNNAAYEKVGEILRPNISTIRSIPASTPPSKP